MDNPFRQQETLQHRRQIIFGLAFGNGLLGLLVLVLAAQSSYPQSRILPWRLETAALVLLIMGLLLLASFLYYSAWLREIRGAQDLLAQGLRYRTLLRTASDGIHVLDREGRITELSDSFARMLGRSREALMGQHVSTWDASHDPQAMAAWFAAFSPGQLRSFDSRHRRADGSLIDVAVSCADVRVDGQDLIYCSARDTSELRQARRALQAALHEQELMLNNDLVSIVRTRGMETVWANPAMGSIFGYVPEEYLGRTLRMLFPDDAAYRGFVDAATPALRAGQRFRRQVLTLRKNGATAWIDAYGVKLAPQGDEVLWLLADITPIQESLHRAEYIAFHDALTGLPNRLLLADRLRQGLAQAERDGRLLSVCFLDLDGFKQVNDMHGHAAGDELLQEVARRLVRGVRANDTVSRQGGDEFVLLLSPQDGMAEIGLALERLRAEIAQPIALLGGSQQASVTASIGVAVFPKDGTTPEALLENADRAMYRAKRSGRDRVSFHEGSAGG